MPRCSHLTHVHVSCDGALCAGQCRCHPAWGGRQSLRPRAGLEGHGDGPLRPPEGVVCRWRARAEGTGRSCLHGSLLSLGVDAEPTPGVPSQTVVLSTMLSRRPRAQRTPAWAPFSRSRVRVMGRPPQPGPSVRHPDALFLPLPLPG